MKRMVSILLSLLLLIAMAGCSTGDTANNGGSTNNGGTSDDGGSSGGDSDAIKIGIFQPLTGASAAGGEYETRGIELAHSLYPEVLGRPVELVKVDNKSDVVEAATAAARLVESEQVDVVLGSWGSSLSMAGADAFEESQTPAITISATSPNVTLGNEYYFRVCFMEDFQGAALATYAAQELGATKAAIIYEITNDTCVGVRASLVETFESLGGEMVGEASLSVGDQDFNSQIMAVMAGEPEVIFIPANYTEAALCISQARALGYDIPFMGTDIIDVPAFLEVGGTDVNGTVTATFFDPAAPTTEVGQEFMDAYSSTYDDSPSALSALGFDAYLAAIKAIEAAGTTDGPAVKDALYALEMEGATGSLRFDDNGDAIKNQVVLKVAQDGEYVYYDTVEVNLE